MGDILVEGVMNSYVGMNCLNMSDAGWDVVDYVYSFMLLEDGSYVVSVDCEYDVVLYVVIDCNNIVDICVVG